MKALLLCAGLGTRFATHTGRVPKPAIPLLNVPMAFYNFHSLHQLGLKGLTVNTHHLPKKIEEIFRNQKENFPIQFSHEEQIMGTGGALYSAKSQLTGSGTFAVANADVVNGFGIKNVLESHKKGNPLATLVVIRHPEAGKKYGAVWADKKKRVWGFGKTPPANNPECKPFHFVGIHLLEEKIFQYLPSGPSHIIDIYEQAIKSGESICIQEKRGFWFEAGSLDEYLESTKGLLDLLAQLNHQPYLLSFYRRYWPNFEKRPNIWEGIGCEHPNVTGNDHRILLGNNVLIHPTVKIEGFAVLGDGVTIDENVRIQNSVICAGKRVTRDQTISRELIL